MPTVLVVDDSPRRRLVIGSLLAAEPGVVTSFADSAEQAWALLSASQPDLVVLPSHLAAPAGGNLAVGLVRSCPALPVVVVAKVGDEALVLSALKAGAASYVSLATLARDLWPTLRALWQISGAQRNQEQLMKCLRECSYCFQIPNDREMIPLVVAFFQDRAGELGLCDDSERLRIGVALEEALVNALFHGNLEISSDLRRLEDQTAYDSLVEQRLRQPPYRNRQIHVEARLSREQATFVVRDEGPGFDPQSLPDPTDPENLDLPCGRGVLLIRTFMDQVTYNERGNEVTLIKRKAACPQPCPQAELTT